MAAPKQPEEVTDEAYLELLATLRPEGIPQPLLPAYAAFEVLLLFALFDGDGDRAGSTATMIAELRDEKVRATARSFTIEYLFYGAMNVVLAGAPARWRDPAVGRRIWPLADEKNAPTVGKLGALLERALGTIGASARGARLLQHMRAGLQGGFDVRARDARPRERGAPHDVALRAAAGLVFVQQTLPNAPSTRSKLIKKLANNSFPHTAIVKPGAAGDQNREPMWTEAALRKAVTRHPAFGKFSRRYRQTMLARRLEPIIAATLDVERMNAWVGIIAARRVGRPRPTGTLQPAKPGSIGARFVSQKPARKPPR